MADRILRERDRALPQRLAALETKVRTLGLRTWQGAVRTAQYLDTYTPATPGSSSVMVSVTVPSGRWIVLATASAGPDVDLAAQEQIKLSCTAYGEDTNAVLPAASFDNPAGWLWWPAGTTTPAVQSVTLVNDVKYDANILIVFTCMSVGGTAFTVTAPRLRTLPV